MIRSVKNHATKQYRMEPSSQLLALLAPILDTYSSSVALLDASGAILLTNNAWKQLTNQAASPTRDNESVEYLEACKTLWSVAPGSLDAINRAIQLVLDGKDSEVAEEFDCSGALRPRGFLMRATRINWPGFEKGFVVLVHHEEITFKRQRDAQVGDEEHLRQLLKTANIISWEADATTWCFTQVGEHAVDVLGYELDEWYTPGFWASHIHPDDRSYAIVLCQKNSAVLDHYEFEYRMIARDGRIVWLHDLVSVVRDDGRPKILHGYMIDITERKRAEEALRDLSGKLISAQDEERSRVARELHDDLNQRLALLAIELEQLGQRIPPKHKHLRSAVHELWSKTQAISSEVHRLSYQLHPSKLDHLGLAAAAKSLFTELSEHHQLKVDFHHRGLSAALPKDVTLCLFRIIQEGLNNVIRHSGVREAKVVIKQTNRSIVLTITDRGCGFDERTTPTGLGLVGMCERLRILGGELLISTQPSGGTQIKASLPLANEDEGLKLVVP
jgi:PAS domain S-box-containing protein